MSPEALNALAATVQHNCHITDARHGADDSLCIYLMKMREYYRWEKRLPYGAALEKDAVGEWLAAREQLWAELEDAELRPLPIDGIPYDPFDADAINARLATDGLVYSGGLGSRAKPHFFLGHLECRAETGGCSVYVAAREYARDLTAPPAMSIGSAIFLRRESLRRMLWEKLEGWRWSRPDNALGRAFACYDFDDDLDGSLEAMTDREIEYALLHEQGEVQAGRLLGDDAWSRMLLDLMQTPAEMMARALRDHLADCLVTLPRLLSEVRAAAATDGAAGSGTPATRDDEAAALHFYLGNLTHLRKAIFPALAAAYDDWLGDGDLGPLAALAAAGARHWAGLGQRLLDLHRKLGPEAAVPIRDLLENNHL